MDPPYITIGVCVRNSERTVKNAIWSILHQDYPHQKMELIIVDDGSTDRTFEFINQLLSKSDIFTKIFRQKWKGIAASRNIIVRNAGGKYIIWVDGDMVLPQHYVYKQVEFMELNPKVAIAKANYKTSKKFKLLGTLECFSRAFTLQRSELLVGTGGSIYRTEVIKEIGGFDMNIHGAGEDIDVVLRVKEKGWCVCKNNIEFIENFRETWKELWREYYWWGYGAHYVRHKHKNAVSIAYRLPTLSFIIGILKFFKVFKMHHVIVSVFLPFHFVYKDAAWLSGFVKSHFDGYGHIH